LTSGSWGKFVSRSQAEKVETRCEKIRGVKNGIFDTSSGKVFKK
jgi:hypothetical protein